MNLTTALRPSLALVLPKPRYLWPWDAKCFSYLGSASPVVWTRAFSLRSGACYCGRKRGEDKMQLQHRVRCSLSSYIVGCITCATGRFRPFCSNVPTGYFIIGNAGDRHCCKIRISCFSNVVFLLYFLPRTSSGWRFLRGFAGTALRHVLEEIKQGRDAQTGLPAFPCIGVSSVIYTFQVQSFAGYCRTMDWV